MSTNHSLLGRILPVALLSAATIAPSALTAQSSETVDLYRVPEPTPEQLERIPKNLARWHMGATLILVEDDQFQRIQVPDVGYFDESIFLSDNSALTYTIDPGQHHFIDQLPSYFEEAESTTGVATHQDESGMVRRAELASTGAGFSTFMAAQEPREVVRVRWITSLRLKTLTRFESVQMKTAPFKSSMI